MIPRTHLFSRAPVSAPGQNPNSLAEEESVLKDTSLRGVRTGRVHSLSGFSRQLGHKKPDVHSKGMTRFIQGLGAEEVAARGAQLHQELRAAFGYKRRELLPPVINEGAATIRTPDFDVNLWLEQDADEVQNYCFILEVAGFRTTVILDDARFQRVFAGHCDTMVIDFTRPFPLEDKIDEIEDLPALMPYLDYPADASSFTLTFPHPAIEIHITQERMTLRIPGQSDLAQLLTNAGAALAALGSPAGEMVEEQRSRAEEPDNNCDG